MKTFKQPQAKQQQVQARGDVEHGDELYLNHRGQPCTGRVLSHGQHGVTVDIGGQQHQVRWDGVMGHKRRVPLSFEVLEQGEDGMLVRDKSGRKRFIALPDDARETGALVKALATVGANLQQGLNMTQNGREIILFFKAAPAAAPLAKKKPDPGAAAAGADDGGEQQSGWNERAEGAGAAQVGKHVAFRNGEHRGHGEVKAVGNSGVTIGDKAGGEHRVLHEQVTHEWGGDGEPDKDPPADEDADEEVLGGYDGKVALPGPLVAELLKTAPREVRAKAAEFLREKAAGDDVEQKAVAATQQNKSED